VAVTPKVAGWPRVTVWLAGWVVIAGLMAWTVKVAGELVTVPAALDTETVKTAPVSAMEVKGVV
jgi:hypothetical protein